MTWRNLIVHAVAATVLVVAGSARAGIYFVSPYGDDSAAGSAQAPWASPAVAAARLHPGDTLVLRAGTYMLSDYGTDIVRPPSGTAGAWITIRGERGGRAVLAGRDNLAMAVELGGRSYVRIENLEVTHDPAAAGQSVQFRDGISIVDGPAAHIVLDDVYIHHVDEFGVDAGDVDGLEIIDSRIEYCGFGAIGGPAGTAGGLQNVAIRRTSLSWSGHYYQGGDGSARPYDRPDGFGIEASQGPILIEDTIAEHNRGDGLDSKADNTTIRRCTVANNSADGVKLWGGGSRVENTLIYGRGDGDPQVTPWAAVVIGTTQPGATFELVNVTVDDRLGANYIMYVQYDDAVPVALTLRNCIFRGVGPDCPIWLRDTVTLTADHNLLWFPQSPTVLVHGEAEYSAATLPSLGTANAAADPLFAAPAWGTTGDYRLAPGSPAIDAGTSSGAPGDDLEGHPRDGRPDLGAFEAEIVRPDGAVRLTSPAAGASDQNPAYAPDGTRIVFTRFDNGYNIGPAGLNVLDLSSGLETSLTPVEDQDSVNLPGSSWHPDLDRIVFASDRLDADDLWTVRSNGGALVRITTHTGEPYYIEPSWSPDGKWIVFEADRPTTGGGLYGEIWKVRTDGGGAVALTSDPSFDDRQPNWSPTGEKILFQRRRPGGEDWDVYTVRPDGGALARITTTSASDTDASFSPDGRWIVYSSDYGGLPVPNIFVIPVTGGTPIRVTNQATNEDGAPSFSPDGRWIAFESHPDQAEDSPASLWRVAAPPETRFSWPSWTAGARLAGAAFDPDMSDAEIDAKLDAAAGDGVSALVVDAPTGWSYTAWTRDTEFNQTLALIRDRVTPRAHARGLKVVWYLTSLELVCGECVTSGIDPGAEHPEWLQVDRTGQPVQFSGVQGVFWLGPNDRDAWLSPESPYRDVYRERIRSLAAAGVDGLWIDVAYYLNALGQFEDLWPSYDPYAATAFAAATGRAAVPDEDWNDDAWREFVRWRERSISGFVREIAAAAHDVSPGLVVFTENWGMDSNFVTQYAQDPLDFAADPGIATAHELEPVDQDNRGMLDATLEQWRSYVLMVRFARASNPGRPAWVLTYASDTDDSLREAAVHLAEGVSFYEAKGPEMLDDTTGSRPLVFPWLADHAGLAAAATTLADVALWYSPRTRDFIDGEDAGDSKFDTEGTAYLAAYRAAGQDLLKAGIPFDIVGARTTPDELAGYRWLVLPHAACLSEAEAALVQGFVAGGGGLAGGGEIGARDQWCRPRATPALAGLTIEPLAAVSSDLVTTSLTAGERGAVLVQAREGADGAGPYLLIVLANLDSGRELTDLTVTARPAHAFAARSATWSGPDVAGGTVPVTWTDGRLEVSVPRVKTGAAVLIRDRAAVRRARGRARPQP